MRPYRKTEGRFRLWERNPVKEETTLQLKVLEKTDSELKIEVEGEGRTFCNLLESVLLEDGKVEFASYNMPHPLISNTVVTIRTGKGKKPEEALKEACEKILQRGKELSEAFANAIKEETK
jgi:DNA-directed RNA polymerase subunit L